MSYDYDYDEEETTYDEYDAYSSSAFEDPPSEADTHRDIPRTESLAHLPSIPPELMNQNYWRPSPPIPNSEDPRVLFSKSVPQTRDYILGCLGLTTQELKASHSPGFIILRLEDFCLIRNEHRSERQIPHIFIHHVDGDFLSRHPDLLDYATVLLNN